MTTDQIALVVAKLVTAKQGDNRFTGDETTVADAARLGDVPETAVKSARTVLQDETEEEIAAVRAGKAKARKTADRIRARKRGKPTFEVSESEPNKADAGSSSPDLEALRREHAEAVKALKLKHANDLVVSGNKRYAEGKKAGKDEGPQDRLPAPAFTAAELNQLRKALHASPTSSSKCTPPRRRCSTIGLICCGRCAGRGNERLASPIMLDSQEMKSWESVSPPTAPDVAAYHEAGHCMAILVFGDPIALATVDGGSGLVTRPEYRRHRVDDEAGRERALEYIVTCLLRAAGGTPRCGAAARGYRR
jgi:hypothetical protein